MSLVRCLTSLRRAQQEQGLTLELATDDAASGTERRDDLAVVGADTSHESLSSSEVPGGDLVSGDDA